MKRKDKVGPKIKYDEMISMYMQGNVKPCGWNESTCKGEIMKIYQACMKIGLRADGSEQCLIDKDSGIRVYVSYYFLLFRYFFISKFDVRDRLGCLGYKYVPPSIVERFYHTINQQTLLFQHFTIQRLCLVLVEVDFLFLSTNPSIQARLHRLTSGLLVSSFVNFYLVLSRL